MNCLHIYTGDGKGKTTASMGLALRSLGSKRKVTVCQFFKNGSSGEIKALQTFDNLTYLKSDKTFPCFFKMTDEQKQEAKAYYIKLFEDTIALAEQSDIIIFDELISTYNLEFLDKEHVVSALSSAKKHCEIVITGREAAPELCEIADYISNIQKIKHPYDKGVDARRGIEF